MTTIIIALLVFGVIIAIHEFGHFAVAKLCGIKVNKFAIGMGPVIFKKQGKETEYSLRLLPVGGFCAMEGEDAESTDPRAFSRKSVPKRMAVVVAGAVMNIILGFLLICTTTLLYQDVVTLQIAGFTYTEDAQTGEKISTSTSESCGLQVGDTILSIDGMRLLTDMDLSYKLQSTETEEMTVVVKRNGEKVTLNNVRFYNTKTEGRLDFYVKAEKCNFLNVVRYSALNTVSTARLIWASLIDLVTGKYGFHDLSGPVGIIGTIGEAASVGETIIEKLISVLSLASFITINVGMFNLLPIPALDGARLVFLLIEGIRRKPINPEHEGLVHFIGLAVLLLIMVLVTFQDIMKIVKSNDPPDSSTVSASDDANTK
ncbi:MAG: RIP metalloprotease RseP [Oscillospiraceae bacterium]|nr:RIP metalloprotease RseP [Oscillospiraceae bacterium]MBR4101020.1 RIP metalloprotease RseP [Oscillospiraceae bacterium]